MSPDYINGAFELVGAVLVLKSVAVLRRDRRVLGVYWPAQWFYASWGVWNLYFYPAVGAWLSFAAGLVMVAGNLTWAALAAKLVLTNRRNP